MEEPLESKGSKRTYLNFFLEQIGLVLKKVWMDALLILSVKAYSSCQSCATCTLF